MASLCSTASSCSPCSPRTLLTDPPYLLQHSQSTTPASHALPIASPLAQQSDYYNYVAEIFLGRPTKTHGVLVDMGHPYSWSTNRRLRPVFDPNASSTYNVVRCCSALFNRVPTATMYASTYEGLPHVLFSLQKE
jgi:hypothetical protein